ncbi:MAG: GTP 3',8-cyclase MoaA [Marinicella sp.]|nr:GTP 3',8-cyclase MoaA [Xanthomonadales bacterium]
MVNLITDQLNRPLHDLRISLTDRCQFRCNYCLPAEHVDVMRQQSQPGKHLSFKEITQAAQVFAQLGVHKIRLTGGEPLLRKGVPDLIRQLKNIKGIKDLAMTTNGSLLKAALPALVDAGLDRITVSLDAIDDVLFKKITGTQQSVKTIIDNIFECTDTQLQAIKVNCVIQKGVNEEQIIPILELFKGTRVEVRFIEFMDVGNLNNWHPDMVLSTAALLQKVHQYRGFQSTRCSDDKPVAHRYKFIDGLGTFGTISSISQPFCQDCSRVRLSADGQIYTCLFSQHGYDIRQLLNAPTQLKHRLTELWQHRSDQYSLERMKQHNKQSKRIEMFVMGG